MNSKIRLMIFALIVLSGAGCSFCQSKIVSTETSTRNEFLEVIHPRPYRPITSPVKVSGKSNFNEANTRIRVRDNNGTVLSDTFTTAEGWLNRLYPFSKDVYYDKPSSREGVVEVFEESAEDGSEIRKITIPVEFSDFRNGDK